MIPAQRKVGAAHPPVLAPMAPGAPGVTSAGYELSCTWMTGLASVGELKHVASTCAGGHLGWELESYSFIFLSRAHPNLVNP